MEMDLASLYEHMHDALDGMYYSYSEHEYHLQKVNSTHNDLVHEAVFTFDKNLAFITWQNLAVLENVEATLPEVITILDGCRAKSVSPFDSKKILSYGQACQILMQLLKEGRFNLDKQILCAIHHYCAQADLKTDDRGAFRRENVIISGTSYVPPKYEDLEDIFKEGIDFINMHVDNPVEKALLAFLFCCRSQFFKDGNKRTVIVKPNTIKNKDGNKSYVVGIGIDNTVRRGFVSSITYAGETTVSLYKLMLTTIKQLFTGGVSAKDLSGPVGIYSIVDSQAKQGFQNIMYLTAYLSTNVGVINLLPFPAFDGGRVLFLIIEKIRRKPVPAKTEAMVNNIGFMLLMLLMVYVTFNDILRLF